MHSTRNRILVVDDEKNQRELYRMILEDADYDARTAASGEAALREYDGNPVDLVLTDYNMTGMDGLALLKELAARDPSIIVVMITAFGSVDSVKEALRSGAYDYLEKPVDRDKLLNVISEALSGLRRLDDEIIGASAEIERVKKMILKVAGSTSTVLIRGESGTGKEKVARAIHTASPRASSVFQAVNCAALNENLLESELFGHEKGSFTGAVTQKKGLFETASGGTLFLDEIGDVSLSTQVKLLRVLQEREIERLGGTAPIKVNVRLIAATHRPLENLIEEGTFRTDLYYRLAVFTIFAPPLRERKPDIMLLADHFLEKYSREHGKHIRRISTPAIDMLTSYHWPGNVRELGNTIERAVLVCDGGVIHAHHLPPTLQTGETSDTVPRQSLIESVGAFERDLLQDALKTTRGNCARAARLLDTTERVFNYKVRKYGIDARRFRS